MLRREVSPKRESDGAFTHRTGGVVGSESNKKKEPRRTLGLRKRLATRTWLTSGVSFQIALLNFLDRLRPVHHLLARHREARRHVSDELLLAFHWALQWGESPRDIRQKLP